MRPAYSYRNAHNIIICERGAVDELSGALRDFSSKYERARRRRYIRCVRVPPLRHLPDFLFQMLML